MIATGKPRKDCYHTDNQETCKCAPFSVIREDLPTAFAQINTTIADVTIDQFPEWNRGVVIKPGGDSPPVCIMCRERPTRKNGKPGDKPICERCYQKYKNRRFQCR